MTDPAVDARQRAEQLKAAEAKYKHRRGDLLSQHRNNPRYQEAVSAWAEQAAAWETRTGRRPVWDLDLW
ncbi:hypothetical protein ACFW9F_14535 [Streptomyces sp. NPDC059506]|uniref:hypothetical protein n=1 Tax=Streptomyces sp. NPDC059506 TaxID=3347751 RepID=UPI0036B88C1E